MQDSEDDGNEDSGEGAGGGLQLQLLRSYLDFGKRAIRSHWLLSSAIVLFGTSLAIVAAVYWPRTFSCTTVLMPVNNSLLDGKGTPPLLVGAEDVILRHENLEGIIRDVGLLEKSAARRPPILKLKDRLIHTLSGDLDEKIQVAILVATLESKIAVTAEKTDLTIKVDWSDGQTAAELAEAARESFVRARHTAEMSAFEEKMAIYNDHSSKLRADIAVFAEQLAQSRGERLNQAKGEQVAREKSNEAAAPAPKQRIVRSVTPRAAEPDAQLPVLKDQLDGLKKKVAELEADRDRRLREAQAKFEDLKVHLTPSHPDVIAQGERVAMLSAVPTDLALLRNEVKDLESTIQQREGFARGGTGTVTSVIGGAGARPADVLPSEITELLRNDDGDPALVAQLSSAISTYTSLRSELLSTRIDLDTAQAAFNHRYQVIIPAEAPSRPDKPKPAMIVIVGLLLSLLIAGGLPIALSLKKGVLHDRWQVEQQLPVLAELHLPPYSGE